MAKKGFFRDLILRLDRDAARRMEEEAAEALERAGRAAGEEFEKAMEEGGSKAVRALTKAVNDEYRRTIAKARIDLARGLIDESGFQEIRRQADLTFNRTLVGGIERLRSEGKLTEVQFANLAGRLKTVSDEAERSGQRSALSWGRFRATIAGVIAAIVGSRAVAALRDWTGQAVELSRSLLRLNATARLYNIEQAELVRQAQFGRRELQLTTTVANGLAATTARFAALAGDAARAQELLARSLDLGAAQGMTAVEVGEALELTLRGQDEGLDRLLQKNPSVIHAEWAKANGRTVASLTETEKRLAIVNALIEGGRRVQGQYGQQLETDVGRLDRWNNLLREQRERVGAGLLPILADLAEFFEGPLVRATNIAAGALEHLGKVLESEAERDIRVLEELGATAAAWEAKRELAIENARKRQQEAVEDARKAALELAKLVQFESRPQLGMGKQAEIAARPLAERFLDPNSLELLRQSAEIERQIREIEEGRSQLSAGERKHLLDKKQALDAIFAALQREERENRAILDLQRARREEAQRAAETPTTPPDLDALVKEAELLKRGHEARLLTSEAVSRAIELERELSAVVRDTNRALDDRLKAAQALEGVRGIGPTPTVEPVRSIGIGISDRLLRPVTPLGPSEGDMRGYIDSVAQAWLEANQDMVAVAQNAAFGITGAFQDAFGILYDDFDNLGEAAEAVLRGIGGAALGGIAEYASGKVKENVALAIEEVAKGMAAAASLNPAIASRAPGHFAAAKMHGLSALKWSLLAGAGGAAQSAIAGGGRGGLSGGIPTGAADIGGRALDRLSQSRPEVHIYIDPLDPANPVYQRNVYAATQLARERYGEGAEVYIHPRTGGAR